VTRLEDQVFNIKFTNASDKTIFISYDGATSHDVVFPEWYSVLSFPQNSSKTGMSNGLAKGTTIYLRGAPTVGASVYLSAYTYSPGA
jgi:hypothetical protein